LGVLPDGGGSTVNVAGVPALSSPNSGLHISDQVVPELDISYFFTPNIAAELILGVTRHHLTGSGALQGLDIGKTTLLPPTLTLQYHFTNFGAFKPYIGAGVNYTVFFNNSASNIPFGGLAVTNLHVSNA
ncbi:OmpW family protein, partial [Herbaspirillum sp. HC18]